MAQAETAVSPRRRNRNTPTTRPRLSHESAARSRVAAWCVGYGPAGCRRSAASRSAAAVAALASSHRCRSGRDRKKRLPRPMRKTGGKSAAGSFRSLAAVCVERPRNLQPAAQTWQRIGDELAGFAMTGSIQIWERAAPAVERAAKNPAASGPGRTELR
jgi:hypothetical protein